MLELQSVSKHFGGVKAVNAVSLSIDDGVVHGLIGPNGAGKTTLINLISGLLKHTSGSISLAGRSVDRLDAHERARIGISRTFQNLRIYPNLSVEQNIDVALSSARAARRNRSVDTLDQAIQRFDLTDKRTLLAGALSYGHMRRLEIVRALALAPSILMLDEPAAGMNETETEDLIAGLEWIRDNHSCAILVIDHDLRFIMTVCQRITVLSMGTVLTTGSPAEVAADPEVISAYLGENESALLEENKRREI